MAKPLAKLVPPYCAVIFTSILKPGGDGYAEMSECMEKTVSVQPGFLGFDSARGETGLGITVSYWKNFDCIHSWKFKPEHLDAQKRGKTKWYSCYTVRIAEVFEDRELIP